MEFKAIPTLGGKYEVSDDGKMIRTLPFRRMRNILSDFTDKDRGYHYTNLVWDKRIQKFRVDELVAAAFLEGYTPGAKVYHIDGNSLNDCADNLTLEKPAEKKAKKVYVKPKVESVKIDSNGYFKTCVVCGKLFKVFPSSEKRVTCSSECSRKRIERRRIVKHCKVCGKEFEPDRLSISTCSPECANKLRSLSCRRKDSVVLYRKHNDANQPVVCKTCGKEFETDLHFRSFCSEECKRADYKKDRKKRYKKQVEKKREEIHICKHCGKEFKTSDGRLRYCSSECAEKSWAACRRIYRPKGQPKILIPVVCKNCGKEFVRTSPTQRYCSDECRHFGYKLSNIPKAKRGLVQVNKCCTICGKVITEKFRKGYCSLECANEGRRRMERYRHLAKFDHIRKCKVCGKEFRATIKFKHFCSEECAIKGQSETKRQNNLRYYATQKRKRREKSENTIRHCALCGKEFSLASGRRKYCSAECAHEADVQRQRRKRLNEQSDNQRAVG